jgi:urease accessory protein
MQRLIERRDGGDWPALEERGTLSLAFDERHRRRFRVQDDRGADLLVDLPRAVAFRDGDGLRAEQGGWWRIVAAAEAVLEVVGHDQQHLARLAWHLGNRHCPTEIRADSLRIRHDRVVEAMLIGLDARCRPLFVPFDPERGAYAPPPHGHDHSA